MLKEQLFDIQNSDSLGKINIINKLGKTMKQNRSQCSLNDLKVNQKGIVQKIKCRGELGSRIREMGIIPGNEITVVGESPFKDPLALKIQDTVIVLRRSEAKLVDVLLEEAHD